MKHPYIFRFMVSWVIGLIAIGLVGPKPTVNLNSTITNHNSLRTQLLPDNLLFDSTFVVKGINLSAVGAAICKV